MRDPGIDPRDELWLARQARTPAPDDDGVCFGTFNDEVLGPFRCKVDAESAQNRKLAELEAQGIDLAAANPRMAVIFADPAVYHVPSSPEGSINA